MESTLEKMSRLRLCEMRVLMYYVENEALFETWKSVKRKESIIILWGMKIYMKQSIKQQKGCTPLCQTYKTTIILN